MIEHRHAAIPRRLYNGGSVARMISAQVDSAQSRRRAFGGRYAPSSRFVLIGLIIAVWLQTAMMTAAVAAPPVLERIDVPAGSPELWPKFADSLIAVSRAEFQRRWNMLRPQPALPPPAVLETLELSATLVGTTLASGVATFRLQSAHAQQTWLSVSESNLAINAVTRDGSPEEVVWGAAEDGRLWILADPPQGQWTASWALGGRTIAGKVVFDLQLPQALTSRLELRLPAGKQLRSPQVTVQPVSDLDDTGWSTWRVLAGSESNIRLIVEDLRQAEETPVVLYRRQLTAGIREDHLRFEVTFQPEVLGGEVDELLFSIPSNAELDAVTWGSDVPLVWSRSSSAGPRHLIRARLPDRQRGTLRQVQLAGIVVQRPGAVVTLPQIEMPSGVFRGGGVQVSVTRPLQIVSMRTLGCRQESPVLFTAEGETYQFQQTVPTSQVTLEVRRPRSQLQAELLTRLHCRPDEWTMSTEILWTSTSGANFQLGVQVPAEWDVTNVRALSSDGREERVNWEAAEDGPGWVRLTVELLEALTQERPRRLILDARRRAPELLRRIPSPLVVPQDCQSITRLFEVTAGDATEVYADPESAHEVVDPAKLPVRWREFVTWPGLAPLPESPEATPSRQLWMLQADPARSPVIAVYSRLQPVAADVHLAVEVVEGLLTETIEIRVRPRQSQPVPRLLVYVSEAGDDITWSVSEPQGWDLVAGRIPREHQPQFPQLDSGELWELRLPLLPVDEIVVRGLRVRPFSLPRSIGLVLIPQAEVITARVSLDLPESSNLQIITRELEDISRTSLLPPQARNPARRQSEWRYDSPDAEMQLVSRRSTLQETPCLATLNLRSLVSAHLGDYDYHLAEVQLPSYPRALRFHFRQPVDVLHAELDDQPLAVSSGDADEIEIVVPASVGDQERRLSIVYRSEAQRGFLSDTRNVPLPGSDVVVWTACRWEMSAPPMARVVSEPQGIRWVDPLPGVTWSERLFGPMSRSAQHRRSGASGQSGIFLPWNADSWNELVPLSDSPVPVRSLRDGGLSAPTGWSRHIGYAPSASSDWTVTTWHRGRIQLLSWISLLSALTAALTIRTLGFRGRTRVGALWMAVWTGIAVAVEPPFVEIVGGLLTGTMLGWLVPRRWLTWQWTKPSPQVEVPTGSTQKFTLPPGVVTTLWLLAGCLADSTLVWALPGEPPPERALLVPVDAQGAPTPLVYLTRENWDRIVAETSRPVSSTPRLLLQTAEYRGTLAAGQRVALQAEFDLLVIGDDSEAVVTWPVQLGAMGVSAAQSCRVDGRPAVITARPDGDGFQISWNRPDAPVSAIGASSFTRHRVALEWQHVWRREAGQAVFDLTIPFAGSSRLTLQPVPLLDDGMPTGETTRNGGTATDGTATGRTAVSGSAVPTGVAERIAGLTDRFRVAWREVGPGAEPIEVEVETLEAWALQASVIDVRSRSTFHPRTGAARRVILRLPPDSVIRRWSSSQPAEFRPAGREELPGGMLEFHDPLVAPVTIDVDYVTPLNPAQTEFRWSGLTWHETDDTKLAVGRRLWAISAPDERRLQPQALDESGLVPVALEAARPSFADLIADRAPRVVYQVTSASPVVFQPAPAALPRRTLLWQQTGTITPNRLLWEVEGEIEITGLPLYTHVLSIDRRLNVESISVRERGAERLVRYRESRSSSNPGMTRLTLFLTDPATELQQIRLQASARINTTAAIPLPNVRFEDAQLSGGRLLIKTADGAELDWVGQRGLRELTEPPANAGNEPIDGPVQIFDQVDPDWRATVRVLTTVAPPAAQVVHLIHSEEAESLQATSLWRIPASRLTSNETTIVVPGPWELAPDSHVVGGQLDVDRRQDGSWELRVSAAERTGEVLAVIRLQMRSAVRGTWLPLPRPAGELADSSQVWVGELTRLPQLAILGDDEATTSDDHPPAEWGSGRWQEPVLAENDRLRWWTLPPETHRVRLAHASTDMLSSNIEWLEHAVWYDENGHAYGVTYLRLEQAASAVVVEFPESSRFSAAIIGQRAGVTRTEANGRVQLAAHDGQPFPAVWLIWHSELGEMASPITVDILKWPTFPNSTIRQLAVTLFPPGGSEVFGRGPWSPGDWVDRSLLRLETLSDQFQLSPEIITPAIERQFFQLYQQTVDQFAVAPDALGSANSERRNRWQNLVERVNQRDLPADSTPPPSSTTDWNPSAPAPGWIEVLAPHRDAAYGMVPADMQDVRVWRIEQRWLHWVIGACLALLSWPAWSFIIRPERGVWLQAHPRAATLLLGGVWWLCLAPSILGFAIVVSVAVHCLTDFRWTSTPNPQQTPQPI